MDGDSTGRILGRPDSFAMVIPVFPQPIEDDLDEDEEIAELRRSEPRSWMGGSGLSRVEAGVYRRVFLGNDEQPDETPCEPRDAAAVSAWASQQDAGAALAITLEPIDPDSFPEPEEAQPPADDDEDWDEDADVHEDDDPEPHTAWLVSGPAN